MLQPWDYDQVRIQFNDVSGIHRAMEVVVGIKYIGRHMVRETVQHQV